jgi:hypothetical protein
VEGGGEDLSEGERAHLCKSHISCGDCAQCEGVEG